MYLKVDISSPENGSTLTKGTIKGFTPVAGIYFKETTSPTRTSAPVKMMPAVVNEKGLPVYHQALSQAFVQSPLEKEIFISVPFGFGELSGKSRATS